MPLSLLEYQLSLYNVGNILPLEIMTQLEGYQHVNKIIISPHFLRELHTQITLPKASKGTLLGSTAYACASELN